GGLVPMLGDARPRRVWGVQEVRGQFTDEWELPRAVLFPSERGGPIGGDTFATALGQAASQHLRGPVTKLTPHVLRHAYASRLHGECLSAAWRAPRLGRDRAALGAPVAVHHGPLRARRRRDDRKRLPAGGRTGRRPVQGVEACNGTCGWPPPSAASGGLRICGGCSPRRARRPPPGTGRLSGPGRPAPIAPNDRDRGSATLACAPRALP